MFCLRSWVPLLVFLTSTPPIYVVLFLLAHYRLSGACVYCSILLFVLVFSLFDFSADWFEPRWNGDLVGSISTTTASFISGNATFTEALVETASIAVSAINGTGGSLASAAMDGIKHKMAGTSSSAMTNATNGTSGFEWLRGALDKYHFRIPCLDVTVRL
ncbi:hypothetical protein PRZ48_002632 [Zasmidium cellare]|uniref:Uncharacterized protein n=1 Tax=Zasmidium cellare TaxID=395010 RepID=A0ABR0EU04_ZASCE|nr:hypothetical protein PRZ48_002632 [Zasmidium cellare]